MFQIWPFVGLRRAEMQGLCWEDVDFAAAQLHVRHQLREDGSLDTTLKTEKSLRTVDLTEDVVKTLRAWKLECPPTLQDLVFPTPRGLAQTCKPQFYTIWHRTCENAGLEGCDPHDMRHTFATWNLAAGENPIKVAEALGHEKPSMTLDTYGHLLSKRAERGPSKLAEWYASEASESGQFAGTARILPQAV